MEALHMRVLRGLAGLDMDQLDLPLDTPSQKMATGQFGAVVAANGPRFATLLDDFVQHACHAPAGEAGVLVQCETLARKCIKRLLAIVGTHSEGHGSGWNRHPTRA